MAKLIMEVPAQRFVVYDDEELEKIISEETEAYSVTREEVIADFNDNPWTFFDYRLSEFDSEIDMNIYVEEN